jgi:hypothetical protein
MGSVNFLNLHEKVFFLIDNTVGAVLPLQAEFLYYGKHLATPTSQVLNSSFLLTKVP